MSSVDSSTVPTGGSPGTLGGRRRCPLPLGCGVACRMEGWATWRCWWAKAKRNKVLYFRFPFVLFCCDFSWAAFSRFIPSTSTLTIRTLPPMRNIDAAHSLPARQDLPKFVLPLALKGYLKIPTDAKAFLFMSTVFKATFCCSTLLSFHVVCSCFYWGLMRGMRKTSDLEGQNDKNW